MPRHARLAVAVLAGLLALPPLAGCGPTALPNREERLPHGYLYYLDGAGGGSALVNWCPGVRDGLLAAGYAGACEMFEWQTGLGAIADQDADATYKRSKAADLAARIGQYRKDFPAAPVSLIGLSAGTAVAVFTLEALPEDRPADTVVLLGASIGADYDLTEALRRIRNKLYVFTSDRDTVLGFLLPITGTADRQFGRPAAGVKGFILPPNASEETRRLYADRLVTIAWTKDFERDGNYGQHLDNVNKDFIRQHVAPLVMQAAR